MLAILISKEKILLANTSTVVISYFCSTKIELNSWCENQLENYAQTLKALLSIPC
jgi:hypothetical protein